MILLGSPTVVLFSLTLVVQLLQLQVEAVAAVSSSNNNEQAQADNEQETRIKTAKMNLWSRGAFALDDDDDRNNNGAVNWTRLAESGDNLLEEYVAMTSLKLGPVRSARQDALQKHYYRSSSSYGDDSLWSRIARGGSSDYENDMEQTIQRLGVTLGQEFLDAIEQNKKDHQADCQKSCELFYCANEKIDNDSSNAFNHNETSITSYSFGPVPPEDFASHFGFPLDLIKVTAGKPLFSAKEAANVIEMAQAEGVDENQYESGKYRLGGDWLVNLPKTREWFNQRLEATFFPLLAQLFPEIISSPAVLRAHSVSLLKYNTSHPRTDVHIDNGILAMTLAMTPQHDYVGGGTFFEHMGTNNILEMDVGHGTFRPGSVRHGGHKVTDGTRYILGAFLLLENKVEHVRRLKNRGSELRTKGHLEEAAKHFQWALELNPKCTTCLKDWAEILFKQQQFQEGEAKIRRALELLEYQDSDAWFNLGLMLSEQGRDDESIEAYTQSLALNADDAQLCYNLGVKLGAKRRVKEEMKMYAQATQIDPKLGGAWLNWGTALAEAADLDTAEVMFLKASQCGPDYAPQAMMNLGILYYQKANTIVKQGDYKTAQSFTEKAAEYVDTAKPLLELLGSSEEASRYLQQYRPLRMGCHRLLGQIHGTTGDYASCEKELRLATQNFPEEPGVWQMLGRILEVQGGDKVKEAKECLEKVAMLMK